MAVFSPKRIYVTWNDVSYRIWLVEQQKMPPLKVFLLNEKLFRLHILMFVSEFINLSLIYGYNWSEWRQFL